MKQAVIEGASAYAIRYDALTDISWKLGKEALNLATHVRDTVQPDEVTVGWSTVCVPSPFREIWRLFCL